MATAPKKRHTELNTSMYAFTVKFSIFQKKKQIISQGKKIDALMLVWKENVCNLVPFFSLCHWTWTWSTKKFNFRTNTAHLTPDLLTFEILSSFNPNSKYIRTGIRLNENKSKIEDGIWIYSKDKSRAQLNKQNYTKIQRCIWVGDCLTKSYRTKFTLKRIYIWMVLKMVYIHICIQDIFVLSCRVAGTTGSTSSWCFFLLLLRHCSQHFVASACKINIVLVGRNQTPSYIDSSLKLIYLNRHFVKERRRKSNTRIKTIRYVIRYEEYMIYHERCQIV